MAYDAALGHIVLFGGQDGNVLLNDTGSFAPRVFEAKNLVQGLIAPRRRKPFKNGGRSLAKAAARFERSALVSRNYPRRA